MGKLIMLMIGSYILWLIIISVGEKCLSKYDLIWKMVRRIAKMVEIYIYIMIVCIVYLYLFIIFVSLFNIGTLVCSLFMNESVAKYLTMIGILILVTYRGQETITCILMGLDKISKKKGTKILIIVLCKALKIIRIKVVIYFVVIVANVIAFIDLKTDMNFNSIDNEMMLYVTVTFIAIDCFIDKLKLEIDNIKKDVGSIKNLFKDE